MSQIFDPSQFTLCDLKNPKMYTSVISSWNIILNLNSTRKPKRSWFDPDLDYETGVHIHFMGVISRSFVLVTLSWSLKNWASDNSTTSSNHLKTRNIWIAHLCFGGVYLHRASVNSMWNLSHQTKSEFCFPIHFTWIWENKWCLPFRFIHPAVIQLCLGSQKLRKI